jgi:protein translocase SecG subunit
MWANSILTWMTVIVALVMTFLILLQNGKGGALSGLDGTKAAEVEGVGNPVRRATGYLAVCFFGLAVLMGIFQASPL